MVYLPIIATLILSAVHFFFEEYVEKLRKYDVAFISFSGGLFVSYLFLSLFPEIIDGFIFLGGNIFFALFWGFVIFHIVEKYIYKHTSETNVKKRIVSLYTFGFFVNHFIIGVALVFIFRFRTLEFFYLSLIPVFFHIISSSLVIEHLHKGVRESLPGRLVSSGSIFLGAIAALLINLPLKVFFAVFAFIIGTLFYIIVRDTLPKYKEGKPVFFMVGVILYLLLLGLKTLI